MKGGIGIIAALAALALGSKKSTTNTGGYQPLDYSPAPPAPPAPETFKPFVDWSTKQTIQPTGLKIVNLNETATSTAPAMDYAAATRPSSAIAAPSPVTAPVSPNTGKIGWNWYTPGGTVTSREPTPEEEDSGLGCPEVPDIWTYPGQSQQDLRYCSNPSCPSNKDPSEFDRTIEPGSVPPTPAVLQDQGAESPPGKRWWCSVCRTYQG